MTLNFFLCRLFQSQEFSMQIGGFVRVLAHVHAKDIQPDANIYTDQLHAGFQVDRIYFTKRVFLQAVFPLVELLALAEERPIFNAQCPLALVERVCRPVARRGFRVSFPMVAGQDHAEGYQEDEREERGD